MRIDLSETARERESKRERGSTIGGVYKYLDEETGGRVSGLSLYKRYRSGFQEFSIPLND